MKPMMMSDARVAPAITRMSGIRTILGNALNVIRNGRTTRFRRDQVLQTSPAIEPAATAMSVPATAGMMLAAKGPQIVPELEPPFESTYSSRANLEGELIKNGSRAGDTPLIPGIVG